MYGAVAFYKACRAADIKPIIGCEVYLAATNRFDKTNRAENYYHMVLLCENQIGYQNLIKLVSMGFTEGFYTKPRIDMELLERHHEGLIALSACLAGKIPRDLLRGQYEEARAYAMMDEYPRLERAVKEAEEKASGEAGGVDDFCKEIDERIAEVKAELDQLAVERTEKAKLVNPRTLLYYERLRTKRWPVAVMLNADSVCEGCHLKVPPSTEQMVEHKMELVACTNCGRMLYRDL
jgi:DNA polymerase III alpha subunit